MHGTLQIDPYLQTQVPVQYLVESVIVLNLQKGPILRRYAGHPGQTLVDGFNLRGRRRKLAHPV